MIITHSSHSLPLPRVAHVTELAYQPVNDNQVRHQSDLHLLNSQIETHRIPCPPRPIRILDLGKLHSEP